MFNCKTVSRIKILCQEIFKKNEQANFKIEYFKQICKNDKRDNFIKHQQKL